MGDEVGRTAKGSRGRIAKTGDAEKLSPIRASA
jgi:hypothetical protein